MSSSQTHNLLNGLIRAHFEYFYGLHQAEDAACSTSGAHKTPFHPSMLLKSHQGIVTTCICILWGSHMDISKVM